MNFVICNELEGGQYVVVCFLPRTNRTNNSQPKLIWGYQLTWLGAETKGKTVSDTIPFRIRIFTGSTQSASSMKEAPSLKVSWSSVCDVRASWNKLPSCLIQENPSRPFRLVLLPGLQSAGVSLECFLDQKKTGPIPFTTMYPCPIALQSNPVPRCHGHSQCLILPNLTQIQLANALITIQILRYPCSHSHPALCALHSGIPWLV